MKRRIFMAVVLLLSLCACSKERSSRQYIMDKVCDTEPRLKITKIMVTDKETIVNCKYFFKTLGKKAQNPGGEALGVAPPGDPAAIAIIADGSGKKYKLLRVSGIPTL